MVLLSEKKNQSDYYPESVYSRATGQLSFFIAEEKCTGNSAVDIQAITSVSTVYFGCSFGLGFFACFGFCFGLLKNPKDIMKNIHLMFWLPL